MVPLIRRATTDSYRNHGHSFTHHWLKQDSLLHAIYGTIMVITLLIENDHQNQFVFRCEYDHRRCETNSELFPLPNSNGNGVRRTFFHPSPSRKPGIPKAATRQLALNIFRHEAPPASCWIANSPQLLRLPHVSTYEWNERAFADSLIANDRLKIHCFFFFNRRTEKQ